MPEIRFPRFTGDWGERKLSELMEFSNGINAPKESYGKGRKMISVMDILANESIIYENIRNSVQVNDKTESKNKVENGDLVFVRSSEIPDEVGWAKAYRQEEYALYSGFSIRGKKKSDFDAKFIELSLNYSKREQIERKAGGSTRFNVSQSILKSIEILEPSIEEQIEIGNFIEKLDETIALHQQELTTLKQTKQGFLQKMFPKEGESVPEVRFPGFIGEWEQRRLGEISEKVTEKNRENTYSETLTNSAEFGIVTQREFFDKDISNEKNLDGYYIVRPDDFVYNPRISNFAPVGPIKRNKLGRTGVMSPLYYVFRAHEVDKTYLEKYFSSNSWHIFMKLNGDSGARSDRFAIKDSLFREMSIPFPSNEEQIKIGNFFDQLDETIALHQQELDFLKETKKAFLQKMFV